MNQQPADFFAPIQRLLFWGLQRLWLWVSLLFVLYLGSNICMIQPDEVAVVLRYGQLQGRDTPQALHPPGLLWALPKPIDTVIRIPKTRVFELDIRGLHTTAQQEEGKPVSFLARGGLEPEKVGYVVTGDGNILHLHLILRYELSDPIAYTFDFEAPDSLMRQVVMSTMVQSVGARPVDDILSDGRSALIAAVVHGAQEKMSALGLGVQIVSLELVDLVPPYAVKDEFEDVQSSEIEAQTAIQKAKEYRAAQIPLARTQRSEAISEAKEAATLIKTEATSKTQAFLSLAKEAQQQPEVVHERLYREGLENVLSDVGQLRFVPPPVGQRYANDFRLQLEMDPR